MSSFSSCQAQAMHLLHGEENVFLTGAAGTGKSFLLQQYLRDKDRATYPVVASTGAAAVIVGGRTFHSFFGLGIIEGGKEATVIRALRSAPLHKRLLMAQCIIIDEVSMLSGETLATAEEIARRVRKSEEPWGGLRIIAVGDFAQLPPVRPSGSSVVDWAFLHPVWKWTNFSSAYLHTTVRTTEPRLLSVLNAVRAGCVSDEVRSFLNERTYPDTSVQDCTRMFPRRALADAENARRLDQIKTPLRSIETQYKGRKADIQKLQRNCPLPDTLHIKTGALVMLRKNATSFPYSYVNGTLAKVAGIDRETLYLDLLSGEQIELGKEFFTLLDGNGEEQASAYNFPVTLAWATTIHKAQGASIDRMYVDLGGLWESGHAYVALSRARSENGLYISRWSERGIFVDPSVDHFYQHILQEWEIVRSSLPNASPVILSRCHSSSKGVPKTVQKGNHLKTREYVEQKKSLTDISEALSLTEGTILRHIERLIREGDTLDIEYLRPDATVLRAVHEAFEEYGMDALKPVYHALGGTVSYDDIALSKVFVLWEKQ